jgi:hypothetical protein
VEFYFEKLGRLIPKDANYYHDISLYFLERKKFTKAYTYMVQAIKNGLSQEKTRNFEVEDFDEHHKALIRKNFLNNQDETMRYFYTKGSGNFMKFNFIRSLFLNDQCARTFADLKKDNKDALHFIQYIDSINMDTLIKFIKTYGMITTKDVSGDSYIEIVLFHLKRYNNNYLDSCILDNCKKKLLHPNIYTYAVDQIQEFGFTYYGTFMINQDTKFLDVENVDKRRMSVGLASLYECSLYSDNLVLPHNYIVGEKLKAKYNEFLTGIKHKVVDFNSK